MEARRYGALAAVEEFAMYLLSCTEDVDIEATLRRRPEANDELDLGTWDRDARRVAVPLVDE